MNILLNNLKTLKKIVSIIILYVNLYHQTLRSQNMKINLFTEFPNPSLSYFTACYRFLINKQNYSTSDYGILLR